MNKLTKKLLSFALAVLMIFSYTTPVMATVDETQSSKTTEIISTNVVYNQNSNFTVTIPKKITLDNTKNSAYTITLSGDIASDETVTVIPETEFEMSDQSNVEKTKPDVIATVTQDKTEWTYDEFDIIGNGTVSAPDLSAGSWKGTFYFNISHNYSSSSDAIFTENPDGTVDAVIPPAGEPDAPVEIPAEELPTTIDFTYGEFESTTTYTPGEYATVEYQEDVTTVKYPVSAQGFIWSKWHITKNDNDNIISVVPYEIALTDIDTEYSTYIAYDFDTEEYLVYEGVAGDSVQLYTIYSDSNDTLENIIYLAAYYQKATGADLHVAQWNGSCYEAVDYDAEIDAVDTFTVTTTTTKTKQVLVSAPSVNTTYAYVPVGTMNAEDGMTWAEWLVSEYNTTGETTPIIKTSNFEDVSYNDAIVSEGCYGFYIEQAAGSATFDDGVTLTVSELGLEENASKYGYWEGDFSKDFSFSYCSSLVSAIVPTGVRTVSFQGCENLVSVVLPSDMTKIESSAFWDCRSLTSIEIPDNVTIIDDGAFYGTAIEHITIPANVTYIGYTSFFYCTDLRSINFDGTVAQWNAIEFGEDWNKDVPAKEVICSDGTVSLT